MDEDEIDQTIENWLRTKTLEEIIEILMQGGNYDEIRKNLGF